MKIMHKLVFVASILCSTTLPMQPILTAENTIIVTDLDDVLIEKTFILSLLALLKPLEKLIKTTTKNEAIQNEQAAAIPTDKKLYGYTLPFLRYGMKHPWLASYMPWIVEKIAESHRVIDGTYKIYHYLKQKGYIIVIATNKDRAAYDLTIKSLGNKFIDVISHAFIANPPNNPEIIAQLQTFANKADTPTNYKQLLESALGQSTADITLVPSKKPDPLYFEYVNNKLENKDHIIFIDDKIENVDGFNELKNNKNIMKQFYGICFNNPIQLAEEFIKLGILSEIDDRKFLNTIGYPKQKGRIMRPSFTNLITSIY